MQRVWFEQFGGPEVLIVGEAASPQAGPGEVRVAVRAAGLNPVDYKIFHGGPIAQAFGVVPPAGVGRDFAGVVDQVGPGVTGWAVGDEVLGSAGGCLAEQVVVPESELVAKPAGLSWDVAGGLGVAGKAAVGSVAAIDPGPEDVVLISAAAGGVGVIAAQLVLATGAKAVGTASPANHAFLGELGVVPVAYGDGLVERLRAAAPEGYTAVLDNHGPATIEIGLELGVPPTRINSIAAFGGYEGVTFAGAMAASSEDLARIAQLAASGALQVPIDSTYPLAEVSAAYTRLEQGHLLGKVVVTVP